MPENCNDLAIKQAYVYFYKKLPYTLTQWWFHLTFLVMYKRVIVIDINELFMYSRQESFIRYVICKTFLSFYDLSFNLLNNVFYKEKAVHFDI